MPRSKNDWCALHGIDPSVYSAWIEMRQRCNNPKNHQAHNYGGRGIKVCARWRVFANFEADMGPRPGPKYSLDRIRTNGDYRRGNCRWATTKQQAHNQRRGKLDEWKAMCIRIALANGARGCDIAEQHGIARSMVTRIKTGLAWM